MILQACLLLHGRHDRGQAATHAYAFAGPGSVQPACALTPERLLRTLLGQLQGMVYRCRHDAHWTMEFVSDGCLGLTGYSAEDLLLNSRVSYEDVTHPEDRPRVRREIGKALLERRLFELEYRIIRADGSERWAKQTGRNNFQFFTASMNQRV